LHAFDVHHKIGAPQPRANTKKTQELRLMAQFYLGKPGHAQPQTRLALIKNKGGWFVLLFNLLHIGPWEAGGIGRSAKLC